MEKLNQEQPKSRTEYLKSALEMIPSDNLSDITKQEIIGLTKIDPNLSGMSNDLILLVDVITDRLKAYEKLFDTTEKTYDKQITIEELQNEKDPR